jgi:ABC-2 type transport system permease protein
MLFLFLSGFQSALTLLEERDAGVMERVAAGPAGVAAAIDGKFAFIVVQGLAQVGVILATAALLFGVDVGHAPAALAAAAVAAALAAAGVTIAITALCRSRAQAHAIGTVFSLVAAAIGGSMAPKFLMPESVRQLGAWTPNALGIDAFGAALWTGGGLAAAAAPLAALAATGLCGLAIAHVAARTTLRADA